MPPAITLEHVTKQYRGAPRVRNVRHLTHDVGDLARRLARGAKVQRPSVTALDDVNLEVEEGEAFGIIGPNGAGKSTALKIVTRVTYPTSGRMRVRGRVGALLEVGIGLHHELTGRENIWLYGRILGLRKRDIAVRFDRIVEFAGIAAALDQPVKHYSSGMQLRLGFSIAAHIEPDVLLVDEALAVGDAVFQNRCVERMNEIVRAGGTLVFVSHDMSAMETLCSRVVWLEAGRIEADGPARQIVSRYLAAVEDEQLGQQERRDGLPAPLEIERVALLDAAGDEVSSIASGDPLTVRLFYAARVAIPAPRVELVLTDGRVGGLTGAALDVDHVLRGRGRLDCTFDSLPLRPRVYEIWCGVRGLAGPGHVFPWQRVRRFRVVGESDSAGRASRTPPVKIPYSWHGPDVEERDRKVDAGKS